ncbi:MAG: hypothetical protein MUC51_02045 [Anaerolineae bacterium]|nr:hypothetical protein [Anaerolineae bacterium]
MPETRSWKPDVGHSTLDTRRWTQDAWDRKPPDLQPSASDRQPPAASRQLPASSREVQS